MVVHRRRLRVRLLRDAEHTQLRIPISLERVGDEPVVRIDLAEATRGEVDLVPRTLDVLAPEAVGLVAADDEFLLHVQRDLDGKRRHRRNDDVADHRIKRVPVDRLAVPVLAPVHCAPSAPVSRHRTRMIGVILHGHSLSAAATDHEALQQGGSFARRSLATLGSPGRAIRLHPADRLLILGPHDVAGVRGEDEDPLLPAQ